MATDLENLFAIKSNILLRLREMTEKPKPTYSIDGQSVDWTEYQRMLFDQLKKTNDLIDIENGPYQNVTNLYT